MVEQAKHDDNQKLRHSFVSAMHSSVCPESADYPRRSEAAGISGQLRFLRQPLGKKPADWKRSFAVPFYGAKRIHKEMPDSNADFIINIILTEEEINIVKPIKNTMNNFDTNLLRIY